MPHPPPHTERGQRRRYADVVVHRLLAASLGIIQLPPQAQDRRSLRDLTANLNDRHRNAQFAGRASVELHTLIFFNNRSVTADARVVKVPRAARMVIGHCEHLHEGISALPRGAGAPWRSMRSIGASRRAAADRPEHLIAWRYSVLEPSALRCSPAGAPERRHRVRSQVRHRRACVPDSQGLRCRGGICCGRGTAPPFLSPHPTGPGFLQPPSVSLCSSLSLDRCTIV